MLSRSLSFISLFVSLLFTHYDDADISFHRLLRAFSLTPHAKQRPSRKGQSLNSLSGYNAKSSGVYGAFRHYYASIENACKQLDAMIYSHWFSCHAYINISLTPEIRACRSFLGPCRFMAYFLSHIARRSVITARIIYASFIQYTLINARLTSAHLQFSRLSNSLMAQPSGFRFWWWVLLMNEQRYRCWRLPRVHFALGMPSSMICWVQIFDRYFSSLKLVIASRLQFLVLSLSMRKFWCASMSLIEVYFSTGDISGDYSRRESRHNIRLKFSGTPFIGYASQLIGRRECNFSTNSPSL